MILHFYRIFNRIDQSESTAKILDLVQVDHWTDHKTNIVAASFQGLLKKTGQNILMVWGRDRREDQRGQEYNLTQGKHIWTEIPKKHSETYFP